MQLGHKNSKKKSEGVLNKFSLVMGYIYRYPGAHAARDSNLDMRDA